MIVIAFIFLLNTNLFAQELHYFIQMALENNLELKSQEISEKIQEINLKKAKKGEFYPEIGLSLTTSQSKEIIEVEGIKEETKTKEKPTLNLDAIIQRPHPFGGRLKLILKGSSYLGENNEKAEISLQLEEPMSIYERKEIKTPLKDEMEDLLISKINFEKTREDMLYDVICSYCEILKLGFSISLKENELRNLQDTLEIANLKLEKGMAAELDVLQISLQLKETELELARQREEKRGKEVRFFNLLGIEPKTFQGRGCVEDINIEKLKERIDKDVKLDQIPEIRIKNVEIEKLKRAIAKAKAKNLPLIIPSWTITKEEKKKEEKIGISISFTLYDKGIKKEDVKNASLSLLEKEISLKSLISNIMIEIKETLQQIEDKERKQKVLRENISLQEKIGEISKIKYERGLISAKGLLDVNRDLAKQKDELASQDIELFLLYINFLKLKGGLFNAYKENIF